MAMTELWCISKPLRKPEPQPEPKLWRFCLTTFLGKTWPSIEHHSHGGSREGTLGRTVRYDMPPEQHGLSLDALMAIYTKPDAPDNRPSWDRDPVLRAKMIERLAKIIVQSTEEGERNNARALYRRLTGKEFTP